MIDFDPDEKIIYEVRKHWLIFWSEVGVLLLIAIAPLGLVSVFSVEAWDSSFSYTGLLSLFVFLYSLWLLVCWVLMFVFWTNYYLDVWIITNKKILSVDQHGLFKREVMILHLDKIQDIAYIIDGLVATTLNYGNISITSAGTDTEFKIKGIPNPALVQSKVNEALLAFKTESLREDLELEQTVRDSKNEIDGLVNTQTTTPRF